MKLVSKILCYILLLSCFSMKGQLFYLSESNSVFIDDVKGFYMDLKQNSVAKGDVDNDGDIDFILSTDKTRLYINDGNGVFSTTNNALFQDFKSCSLVLGDIDNDTDLDLFMTGFYGEYLDVFAKLYTNNGAGVFTENTDSVFNAVIYSALDFKDFDNDNDLDLVVSGLTGDFELLTFYTNNGSGNFTSNSVNLGTYHGSLNFLDVENDNDKDLLITGSGFLGIPTSRLFLNNGFGVFSQDTNNYFSGSVYSSSNVADVDGDGDTDVIISGSLLSQFSTTLYLNDGLGSFSASAAIFDEVWKGSVVFEDIDNDFDQDVLITGRNSSDARIAKLYANDGEGNFSLLVDDVFEGVEYSSVFFADVDNDSDKDLFINGVNDDNLYYCFANLYINNLSTLNDSVFESNTTRIVAYPNPTFNTTKLVFNKQYDSAEITLRNLLGQKIHQENFFTIDELSLDINQPSGVYFVDVILNNSYQSTIKIIKN